MSENYDTRLKEFSETNHDAYQDVLNDCHNDIIEAFCGIGLFYFKF